MLNRLRHPLVVSLIGSVISIFACGVALNATNEIKASRRSSIIISCNESNMHHDQAKELLGALVAKSTTKKLTPAETTRQHELLEILVEAIAPKYNCAARLKKLTKT